LAELSRYRDNRFDVTGFEIVVSQRNAIAASETAAARGRAAGMLLVLVGLSACSPDPAPRTFFDFMEDGIAREGVLARCNRDRDATLDDIECANARRAAAAVALEQERARRADLDLESERKLVALRARTAARAAAEQDAAEAARAEADAAYEAQWRDDDGASESAVAAESPAFGAPLGPVLPSMSDSPFVDIYAESALPVKPAFDSPVAAAPASQIEILRPELDLELEEVAIIPRPFRTAAEAVPQ
jgi:hypothetical protein